jgi:hypoxanthine phosphoribosyltransferase
VEFLTPSWDEIYDTTIELYEKILEDEFFADIIVGVARGGWIPARILSDFSGNELTANVKIEFYKSIAETEEKPRIVQPISVSVENKKVLICDDVADTGESLLVAIDHIKDAGASDVRVAALYMKPWSKCTPEYWVLETDKWIIFPWERRETITKLYRPLKNENTPPEVIKKELSRTDVEEKYIERYLKWIQKS